MQSDKAIFNIPVSGKYTAQQKALPTQRMKEQRHRTRKACDMDAEQTRQTDPFKCGKGHVIILNVYNRVPSKVCMNN